MGSYDYGKIEVCKRIRKHFCDAAEDYRYYHKGVT